MDYSKTILMTALKDQWVGRGEGRIAFNMINISAYDDEANDFDALS